jgi:predicted small secreted protein
MKRIAAVLVAVLLAAATLTGCGGGSGSGSSSADYCTALKNARGKLKNLTLTNSSNLAKAIVVVKGVAAKAPPNLSADWKLLVRLLDNPTSIKASDAQKVSAAGTAIAKDARSRCKLAVNLD